MLMITVIWNQVKAFTVSSNNQDSFMNTWKRNQRAGRHIKVLNSFFFFGCVLKSVFTACVFLFRAKARNVKVKLAAVSINNT